MATRTDVRVVSRALTMIGANPITSFIDGSAEANVATEIYEDLVQEELSMYPWSFAKEQEVLGQLVAEPVDEWTYAYQLPNTTLTVLRVTVNGNPIEYERFGDKVFCDELENVVATYIFRAIEPTWTPYFTSLVVHKLAAVFATAIAERPRLAQAIYAELEAVRMMARNRDSSSQTTRRIRTSRFRRVRNSDRTDVYT